MLKIVGMLNSFPFFSRMSKPQIEVLGREKELDILKAGKKEQNNDIKPDMNFNPNMIVE